ncbi:MAG TPA: HEPN domain-containing protein [Longimicrobiaceae bacterium]|jgi:uncharacterized protein (UPF0332 family)
MTPEQEGLLRKARNSVAAARLLLGEGHHEFAVSRAYYAMFYVADALLRGRGLRFSKHSAVHAAFGQHFARTGILPAGMHRQLIEAAAIRNLGDYEIGPDVDSQTARQLIADAEEFIRVAEERIDQLPSGPA